MKYPYLKLAIEGAIMAGQKILAIYNDPTADFQVDKKSDNSPLTIADTTAHQVIISQLKTSPFPILSEEGKMIDYEVRKNWETLWIVDPLDGTKEFIKRNGEFTVNIALVENGIPVMGVIYLPVKKELYFAEKTLGAYKIDNISSLNQVSTLEKLVQTATKLPSVKDKESFVVVASRSHLSEETEAFINQLKKQHFSIDLITSGSSIKICLVAEGKADIYPRFAPTMEWDTAAGDAIARAAGMSVCQSDRKTPLVYNKENLLNPSFIVEKSSLKTSLK
ncbi:MAG: 3'(2'),5'-bisphosphate nucleotidase CysQ [Bacteroidales bacterium]